MLLTIAAAVIVLGVLIFVHELGHFIAAKAVGVGVPRFSLGLGPVTPVRWRWGETEYVLSWIPFGGYVKMATAEDEDMVGAVEGGMAEEKYPPEKHFENKPLWARIIVILAGVTMNALFAWFLYSTLNAVYGRVEDSTTRIAEVDSAGLPVAARPLTALPIGTKVVRINGDTIASWTDLVEAVTDPRSADLKFEFDGGTAPLQVGIPGQDIEARNAVMERIVPYQVPIVGTVVPARPAERAGVQVGDLIVAVNRDTVRHWREFVKAVEGRAGDTLSLTLRRQNEIVQVPVVPEAETGRDPETGKERTVGRIGVALKTDVIRAHYGIAAAIGEGAKQTGLAVVQVWIALKGLVLGQISPRNIGGVLQIGELSGQFVRLGLAQFLGLIAFFSVNLAVLNLLPIPVLDGGHLAFLIVEGLKGRPLPVALRLRLSQIGMVFLICLMLFALSNDVLRIFRR